MLGEGIVKKEADLAAEVEQQTKEFEQKAAEKAAAAADAPAAEVAAEVADAAKPAVQVKIAEWQYHLQTQCRSHRVPAATVCDVLCCDVQWHQSIMAASKGRLRTGRTSCAQVSAKMVKELRDKSGAGMMDCKKALAETGAATASVVASFGWAQKKSLGV